MTTPTTSPPRRTGKPASVRSREESLELAERRVLAARGGAGAHDRLHRSMRQTVAHRLVEILAGHDADEVPRVADLDTALAVPLTESHRVGDRVVRGDEAGGSRHDLPGDRGCPDRGRKRLCQRGPRRGERTVKRRRGGLRVPSSAERLRGGRGVDLGCPAPCHAHDAAVHLDEAHERPAVREIDELVREHRHTLDVGGPRERRDQHLDPAGRHRLEGIEQTRRGGRARRPGAASEGTARALPGVLRGAGTRQAPRRRAPSSSCASASPCPRGCRARRRSPRAA